MEEINPVTRLEFNNHTHNAINSFRINPIDLFVFTQQVTDATTAPTDTPLNGTVRVLYDTATGGHWRIWVRVAKTWRYVVLT